jgi:hypothetical protein
MTMFRSLLSVTILGLVVWSGPFIRQPVEYALRVHRAASDPVALSEVSLDPVATPARIAQEIDAALASGDADLAASFLDLAERRAIPVDGARRSAVAAVLDGTVWDTALTFARGAMIGDVGGMSGMAGAFAGDMAGIGDLRDLAREGWRLAHGEEPDRLVMGLAAVGLAVTTASWLSAGEAAPARGGLSFIKTLRKAGRLSAELTESVARGLRDAVDMPGLGRALRAAGHLDLSAARVATAAALRPARLAPLAAMSRDAATLLKRGGSKAVEDAFGLARSPRELTRVARLSEGMGRATRATLKLLGRGAILLSEGVAVLAGWLLTGCLWLLALALTAARFGRWLGRIRLRRRRALHRPHAARAPSDDLFLPLAKDRLRPVSAARFRFGLA